MESISEQNWKAFSEQRIGTAFKSISEQNGKSWGGATGVKADLIPGAEHPSTALSGLSDLPELAGLRDLAGPLRPSPALAGPRRLMSAPHTHFGPPCHPSLTSKKFTFSSKCS